MMQDLYQSPDEGCAVAAVNGHHLLQTSVPIAWLEAAAKLPGKSMHLAIVLLRIATVGQTRRVALSNLACERFGLNRNAKYRALRSLENAGLIAVERKLGRSPVVTILCGSGAA
jgi:hypothetical protein